MDDLISRNEAIDALSNGALVNYQNAGHHNGLVKAIDVIKGLPSAQPERTGKWIKTEKHYKDDEQDFYYFEVNCSVCGIRRKIGWIDAKYCPNCGVRIDDAELEISES